ncbi:FtsX-like permease family protein [Clostridioides difficile]|uniref:ABC transporter permease n=1 Tax=Bacillota TaxID=1239 RepID=UPI001C0B1646|nr:MULTISPECIES: ABC transporter permease [Bacillota]MBZ4439146.1 ABC transporter permease [Clostridioides difficile]MEE0466265.1 ABC transporter permease [Holdemanella sp.]QWR01133.1 FtsX-like permease family protein [Clostridioides difficile]
MHDNRNKEVIKRVEKGMMKANRTRNIFAIVAVALTTFMITTIFSLGINYKENMELTSVRTSGTNANVSLAMPTNEQEKEIRDLDYVKTVGTQYMIGSVAEKNEADRDLAIAMQYYDNTEWEKHYKEAISNIKGEYPKKENEIMLSEDALSQLGIKEPKLDMEIPLSYISKDGEQKDTFTLSGWFRSYTGTGMAFLSESYCQEHGYTMQNSGVLSISLDNPKDNFYDIQDDIALNENQTFQGSVSMSSSSGSVYAMIILLVFFIIGSGYLLIYNVLYISISRDTRFYGLIKTLGTTEKQIKTLVKRQALTFGCIGIPIGVILAGVLSFGIVPVILENAFDSGKSIMDAEMFFHPSIFILSIIFSALTVWISCNAPAKVAGKISPIEALRYQNFASTKTKSRNSTNGGKLHVMAYHNVFRDKKRAFLVFMSLFMGITMILGVNGMIGSMKAENYVEKYMDYNFEYRDVQFEQYEQPNKEVPQFDEQFVEQIKQIDGVKNVDIQKTVWGGIAFDEADLEEFMKIKYEDSRYKTEGQSYQEMVADLKKYANAGDYGCYITTLDDKAVEEYNTEHPDTPIDIEKFQRGETAISGMDTEYNAPNTALVGKTLSLTADSPDGKATDFLIDGSFYFGDYENNLSYSMGQRKDISIVPDIIYVSEAGMERLTSAPIISGIGIDIKDMNQLEEIDSELQALNGTLTKTEWSYQSPVGIIEEFNQMNYSMNLLGNGAAVLLIVIGLINFINVMLTGVVARKNEFAVMESIGTSKKQIKKILTLEGGIYALVTTGLIMTLGNAFLLLVADAVPHIADYAKFEYPFALVICLIFAIFIICLSVPAIVYRAVSKETVIERLHDLGN